MYHPTRKANDGGALVHRVKKDAVSVYKEQGWQEYIAQADPIGARRESVQQPAMTRKEEMSAALAELQRIKADQAARQAKAEQTPPVTKAKPGPKPKK
jgi:hypothetical protein